MRIAIISDIHSNLEALEAVLGDIQIAKCECVYCLGDVVGYGPNPNECCALIRSRAIPTVMGNHDEAVSAPEPPRVGWMNPLAAASLVWTRSVIESAHGQWLKDLPFTMDPPDIGATFCHANLHYPRGWSYIQTAYEAWQTFQAQSRQLCFIGHTHVPGTICLDSRTGKFVANSDLEVSVTDGNRFLINCGSVGQPRDGDPRSSYVRFDTETRLISFRRVQYPLEKTQDKIFDLNLPPALAFRLSSGK